MSVVIRGRNIDDATNVDVITEIVTVHHSAKPPQTSVQPVFPNCAGVVVVDETWGCSRGVQTIDLDTEPPEPESAPGQPMTLRVALCAQSNIRAAAQMALAAMPQPKGLVAEDFIRAPIWTTWARYGAKV